MKLIETLTQQELTNLFNGKVVGVFENLLTGTELEANAQALCTSYYLYNSGEKKIPKFYETILKNNNANEIIVSMLKNRFLNRWINIYKALFNYSYSPLDEYSKIEIKTGNNKNTIKYDTTKTKTGNDTDTITYNITNNEEETTNKEENKTSDTSNASDIYGFNSTTPVGDTLDTNNETTTTTNIDSKNNTYKKTGTETKENGLDVSETNSGTDTKDYDINERLESTGRNVHATDLLDKEIKFNIINDLSKIIFKDIDTLITLDVYERSFY